MTSNQLREKIVRAFAIKLALDIDDAHDFANALIDILLAQREALEEAKGCWDAAYVEGFPEAMNEARDGNAERLIKLLDNRLLFALAPTIEALADTDEKLKSMGVEI